MRRLQLTCLILALLATINAQIDGEFRVVNGTSASNGRVEVYHNGIWGTVCDDSFGHRDATMVCKAMGFPGVFNFGCCAAAGEGTGQIWLDDLNCPASAFNLFNCTGWAWERHECGHHEDASVQCLEFRLAEGHNSSSGRVEVWHDGVWGTVCDDNFDQLDADMICREMDYDGAVTFDCCAAAGEGTGPTWLGDIDCGEHATILADCTGWTWRGHDCGHHQDISVTCTAKFRLVEGSSASSGRVEVFHKGIWGTVCDDEFNHRDADMICRSMGYPGSEGYESCPRARRGSGQIWFDNLDCPMNATDLEECSGWSWGQHNCAHVEDICVTCREN